jgi:hypothetical protein
LLRCPRLFLESDTLTVKGAKTKGSAATIPLLPPLAVLLRAHRERQAAKSFARIRPETLIFQTENGRTTSSPAECPAIGPESG